MNIEEEIDKIWENEIKDKTNDKMNSIILNKSKELDQKLQIFENNLCDSMNQAINNIEIELLKKNMNKKCRNFVYNNNENSLINFVLICLSNIELFVLFCLGYEKNKLLEKINEINEDNYFSLFVEIINNIWLKNGDKYSPSKIHDQFKRLNNQIYISNDPGEIIGFFLTKLNDELNYNQILDNNINNINNFNNKEIIKNQNKIKELFFVDYKIEKKCIECSKKFNAQVNKTINKKSPLINLYIQEKEKIAGIGEGNISDLKLKKHFNFLLNDYIKLDEFCEISQNIEKFDVNNYIENLNNNILIINLNRNNDFFLERNIKFKEQLKLKLGNKNLKYELISVIYNINENILQRYFDDNRPKYIAYCKNFLDEKWYLYNENDIKLIQNNNENLILDGQKALLLIYKKIL